MASLFLFLSRLLGNGAVAMGNLLRVLNDRGSVPKVDFFVDFESERVCVCVCVCESE